MTSLCTRICPYLLFEATSLGAGPRPLVKTGPCSSLRGCKNPCYKLGFVLFSAQSLDFCLNSLTERVSVCLFFISIFVLVVSKGFKPGASPPYRRNTVNLSHCASFVFLSRAHPRSPIPPFSALTSRATDAHPTSPRSTGFCAIWGCISSSSVSMSHQITFSSAPNKDSSSPSTERTRINTIPYGTEASAAG